MLLSNKNVFHPITKSKWEGLSLSALKSTITDNGKIHDVIVQRDILGALVADFHKGNSPSDIKKILSFSLSLVTAFGNCR